MSSSAIVTLLDERRSARARRCSCQPGAGDRTCSDERAKDGVLTRRGTMGDDGGRDVEASTVAGRAGAFRAIRVRNYRLFFVGQVLSVIGTWTQATAVGWIVLRETHDSTGLGIVVALQFFPLLVFGAYAGTLADRIDKRRILILANVAAAVDRPGDCRARVPCGIARWRCSRSRRCCSAVPRRSRRRPARASWLSSCNPKTSRVRSGSTARR